jgi:archaellum component FlaC
MTTATSRGNVPRRILGIALLAVGILGVILSIAALVVGVRVVDGVGVTAKYTMSLATDSLDTTRGTLEQTRATVQQVNVGLSDVQVAIADAGQTVSQSDAMLTQLLQVVSQDVPDTLDQVNAAIPPAAETAKSFLGDVGNTMADASATLEQNGPLVNGALQIASRDVPDTLDYMSASIPPAADAAHHFLGSVEATMTDASETVAQADAAWSQAIRFASSDLPDTLDAVHAAVPPAAEVAHNFLDNVEVTMVNAGQMVSQADVALDQAVRIASYDVPNTLDYVNASIPPAADATRSFLANAEVTMVNASAMVDQADAVLDQTLRIVSHDVPDTLDYVNANIPPAAETAQLFLDNLQYTLDYAQVSVGQTEAALDLTSDVVSRQVPDTLDQLNGTLPSLVQATEGNINATLSLLHQLQYLDAAYIVRLDQSSRQLSTNLDFLSRQLRAMDRVFHTNLEAVDQGIVTLSYNTRFAKQQIDQLTAMTGQLELASQQLRGLEPLYNQNVDLEATSRYILDLSGDVAAMNDQVDQVVAMTTQLEQVSGQLRSLDKLYNDNVDLQAVSRDILVLSANVDAMNRQVDQLVLTADQLKAVSAQLRGMEALGDTNLDAISQDMLLLSEDIGTINGQIDQFVAASTHLEQLATQLRALEPYAEVDYAAISQDLMALSGDMQAINGQIDQLVLMTGQLQQLSDQLRTLKPYAEVDFQAVGQDIAKLSTDMGAINGEIEGFVALTDGYIATVDSLNTTLSRTQSTLDGQLALVKTGLVIAAIWILLAQLAPLYLGWELVSGRRDPVVVVEA